MNHGKNHIFAKHLDINNSMKIPVKLTDNAISYLKKVGKPNVSLAVAGGGCSGFQYEWGVTLSLIHI